MWQHLSLRSLGVIESAEIELGPGLTVITGETGAGKTMVITALALLRGQRADHGLLRVGAESTRVEASVALPPGSPVAGLVDEAGGRLDDDDVLLIGRILTAGGRSRAVAGGVGVPAALLSEITDSLVTVHGQGDQHRLSRSTAHRDALDAFGGTELAAALASYRPRHAEWTTMRRQLAELQDHLHERAREAEALGHGLRAVETVDPRPGEDDELRAEQGRLAHAETLMGAAEQAHAVLAGETSTAEAPGARDLVAAAVAKLTSAAGHDPELDSLATRAQEVEVLLDDVSLALRGYAETVETDPARLQTVQQRLADLQTLQRTYGPGLDDVIAWRDTAVARLAELETDETTIDDLRTRIAELEPRLREEARRVSALRREAASRLQERVQSELAALAMPAARLIIDVRTEIDAEPGPDGLDEVTVLFAANPGSEVRPVQRSASGGELSRVMLALEVVLAEGSTVPTYVFDEVDAGVGGEAAVEIGRRLARLARTAQVLVVTHLPQVAAFADDHHRVLKGDDGSVTTSTVVRLDPEARVHELARMLAGQGDSASAREHARELLRDARP